jgi:hypothetical protein
MPISKINTTSITDNSVTAGKITAGAVSSAKIADSAVNTAKIADSAVNSAKIGVDVIAAEDLAANSVTVSEISNGAVTSPKLAANIDIAGTLDVTGVTTLDDTLIVSGTSTLSNLDVKSNTNLLSNSDFTTNTTGWAASGSSLAIVSNQLQLTPNSGVNGFANQQVSGLVVGRSYIASVDVTVDAGALGRLYIGTAANGNQTVNSVNLGVGTHSFSFIATETTHHFALVVGGGGGQVTRFDNAKLTEVSKLIFTAGTGVSPEIKHGNSVNALAIATNAVNRIHVSGNGEVTMPSQPAFQSQSGVLNNLVVGGTVITIPYNEIFDIGNNFNDGTHTFTAPVTGKYQLNVHLLLQNLDSAANYYQMQLTTSNRLYYETLDPDFGQDNYYGVLQHSVLADMDAGDTAFVTIHQATGTAQTDVNTTTSKFSGFLAC